MINVKMRHNPFFFFYYYLFPIFGKVIPKENFNISIKTIVNRNSNE